MVFLGAAGLRGCREANSIRCGRRAHRVVRGWRESLNTSVNSTREMRLRVPDTVGDRVAVAARKRAVVDAR